MTAKRFNIEFDGHRYFLVIDEDNERCLARLDTRMDALAWLEMYRMLSEENEELKKELSELTELLADEVKKNGELLEENNLLRIENMRLKKV